MKYYSLIFPGTIRTIGREGICETDSLDFPDMNRFSWKRYYSERRHSSIISILISLMNEYSNSKFYMVNLPPLTNVFDRSRAHVIIVDNLIYTFDEKGHSLIHSRLREYPKALASLRERLDIKSFNEIVLDEIKLIDNQLDAFIEPKIITADLFCKKKQEDTQWPYVLQ